MLFARIISLSFSKANVNFVNILMNGMFENCYFDEI